MWSESWYVIKGEVSSFYGSTWMHDELQAKPDVDGPFLTQEQAEQAHVRERILDEIYESVTINGPFTDVNWYGIHRGKDSKLYLRFNDKCWEISATPHPHPQEEN